MRWGTDTKRAKYFTLLSSTASILAIASVMPASAQQAPPAAAPATASAAAQDVPEEVLITGSLIHGTAAVGVPVVQVGALEFTQTAALNISDYLRNIPALNVDESRNASASMGDRERGTYVSIHDLGSTRALLMINGMRYPFQKAQANAIDPSVVSTIAVDHIDVLADGASATYGSDALSGVFNIVMKRGFDGALSEARFGTTASSTGGGGNDYEFSQLYGRTWEGGDITVSYHFQATEAVDPTTYRLTNQWTHDYSLWGLDNASPIASSFPGIVSTGKPNSSSGTTCTNCYSVPKGSNGVGLTWASLLANPGVTNEVNSFYLSDLSAPSQTNAFTATFDQRVIPGVQLFADAFYSRRIANNIIAVGQTPAKGQDGTWIVPTSNPYYPVGAPTGLQVSYSFMDELQPRSVAGEISKRFDGGFNLDLPFKWTGHIFASLNGNVPVLHVSNAVNPAAVSAALGNTITVAASGTAPGFTFTKPASVPYLNVFCDPTQFHCNDPATLAYIAGVRDVRTSYILEEYGADFDGPIYSLPAGDLKAAIGIDYTTSRYWTDEISNYASPSPSIPTESLTRFAQQVPAAFVQFNIPVFSEANAVPFIQKLNFEVSGRYDHYYTFGVTKNPKIAFDWTPFDGIIVSGDWGTSFRAPGIADLSATGSQNRDHNIAAGAPTNDQPLCTTIGATPKPGSVAAILNPTCSAALNNPGGIEISGGALIATSLRGSNGDGIASNLGPEKATNTSISLDLLPNFLPGLELRGTYWNVNISNYITSVPISPTTLADPIYRFAYTLNTDPNFANALAAVLALPNNTTLPGNVGNIKWIIDSASLNAGYLKVSGVDYYANYTTPMFGGAITAGLTGTYYLRNINQPIAGGPITDAFKAEPCTCNAGTPRMKARFQLGWTDGTYTMNAFVNYISHYFPNQGSPPPAFLTKFPIYTDIVPAWATLDLSLGYNTGDIPANDYLKNLSFTMVVNDLLDRVAPFNYSISGNSSAFDSSQGETPFGRTLTFIISKRF